MEYINLGKTGLKVSRICLGCMSYGDPNKWLHNWVLTEKEGRPFIQAALEKGINFFDTANVYSLGASEEILGRAIRDFAKREDVVIATKVHGLMRDVPNGKGLSRKAIMTEIDNSLQRLGMDYVDLYQIHRWDYETPIEETLEALHDVVKAGKARYIGASSMHAWQFSKALYLADLNGWTRFVSMQPHYNLLYREEEREMMALCRDQGIGVIPWSPNARGRLTRPSNSEATKRLSSDQFGKTVYGKNEADRDIIDRVEALAKQKNVSMSQIAIAWLLHQPGVTAPIIGATKIEQFNDTVDAVSVKLSPEEIKQLEELYVPHAVAGFV
jgi:1-deoxyxylulose-5-phosphate synthase